MSKQPAPTHPISPAAYLTMPVDRRVAAQAHAAMLSATMQRVAAEIPFTADVDDFRRVLIAEGETVAAATKPGLKS